MYFSPPAAGKSTQAKASMEFFFWTMAIAVTLFAIISIVLFVRDGTAAKKEGRSRNKVYTVLFVIGMTLAAAAGSALMLAAFLYILASLVMRGM